MGILFCHPLPAAAAAAVPAAVAADCQPLVSLPPDITHGAMIRATSASASLSPSPAPAAAIPAADKTRGAGVGLFFTHLLCGRKRAR